MARVTISRDKCKGCMLCISVCPKGHIIEDDTLNRRGLRPVKCKEGAECVGCMLCAIMCPDCCIEVYK